MKVIEDTYFDESVDGFVPIVSGVYPAHVSKLETISFDSGSTVFNVTFRLSEECKKINVNKMISDGDGGYMEAQDESGRPITIDCGYLKDRDVRSQGVWLTPKPKEGEGWRNRNYLEFFESLGVEFKRNDQQKVVLAEVEEEDIIGIPTQVKVGEETYKKDGEDRKTMRVFSCHTWANGKRRNADEFDDDIPF
tara:strand:- start:27 stop:605 length:579 start_codon:yes stop_codon:yes gene_type:complete